MILPHDHGIGWECLCDHEHAMFSVFFNGLNLCSNHMDNDTEENLAKFQNKLNMKVTFLKTSYFFANLLEP
jgi:hypothetical protein